MRYNGNVSWLLLLAAWFGTAAPVSAEVLIYNGFNNENDAFDAGSSLPAQFFNYDSPPSTEALRAAARFTTPTGMPWLITSVVVPVSHNGVLNLRMSVVADEGNTPGSAALWSVVNPPQVTTEPAVRTIPAHVALQPDTTYWLMFEPHTFSGDNASTFWHTSVPPFAGWQAAAASDDLGGTWPAWNLLDTPDRPAFRLMGRPLNETVITEFATAVELRFETEPGGWYVAQYTDDVTSDAWYPVAPPLIGSGGITSVLHSSLGATSRVYRVVTE